MKDKKIQLLRGIAIIAVVAIHTVQGGDISVIIRPFINFAVAMFIFLSGYLTKIENENLTIGIFNKKRIFRVMIPYIIWSIIYTIAYSNYKKFFVKILTGTSCGIYYYILVYIQLVLITPFVIKLVKSKYKNIGFMITPVFMLIYYLIVIILKKELPFPINANNFVIWFIYYYLGITLGNNQIVVKNMKNIKIVVVISLVLQIFEGILWNKSGYYSMATTQLKFTSMISNIFILLLTFFWLSNGKEIEEKSWKNYLIEIGGMSFGIYLSHILILDIFNKIISCWEDIFFPLNMIILILVNCICVLIGRKILGKQFSKFLGLY